MPGRAGQIEAAVREATKEGTVTGVAVQLAGVGPATRDLQSLVRGDTALLVAATLALIFVMPSLIVLLGRWFWWPYRITARAEYSDEVTMRQRHAVTGRTIRGELVLP